MAHPAMKRAAKADGKVRIVYKDWPIFGEPSERAAQVAIASDAQNIYPLVHDRLMTARSVNERTLRMAVELSGGDWSRLQRDLATDRTEILNELERNRMQAFGLGLGGTPGYLIGPLLVEGALDERQFLQVFKEARRRG
jgi:protein-disulfide isomerase